MNYTKGICPVAESLQDESFLAFGICHYELQNSDVDLIIKAFQKVWANLQLLR